MRRPKQPNATIPGCGFHHVAIRTADWDRSLAFWQGAMGFSLGIQWGEAPQRACMLDTGDGNYLEIFERGPREPDAPSEAAILHFCFRTENCDAALERARAAGAEVTMEPKSLTLSGTDVEIRIAFFKGPDGEICELFQNEVL